MPSKNKRYADERIAHMVRLAARGFNRALSRRLAEHDISFGHWVFLRILWQSEGLTQRQLSEIANLTEPTTHTALAKMEALGFIVRRNVGSNKRKQHVFLTDYGRSLEGVLVPLAVKANDVALTGLSAKKQADLRFALNQILVNLEREEEDAIKAGVKVPATRASSII